MRDLHFWSVSPRRQLQVIGTEALSPVVGGVPASAT